MHYPENKKAYNNLDHDYHDWGPMMIFIDYTKLDAATYMIIMIHDTNMYHGLIKFLNKYNINIKYCRGQSYDNTSGMNGKYNGLQSKFLQNNELASWIP